MANNRRLRTTTVATALLAGSAVAAAAMLARRRADKPRAVIPALELTPSHRGGTGTPLLLLHGIGAIWRAWSPVVPYLEPHHDVIVPTLRATAVGRHWTRGWCRQFRPLLTASKTSSTSWACRRCTSPATPSAGGSESSSPAADGRNRWCSSARPGPGGRRAASKCGRRCQVLPRRARSLFASGPKRSPSAACCAGRCWRAR